MEPSSLLPSFLALPREPSAFPTMGPAGAAVSPHESLPPSQCLAPSPSSGKSCSCAFPTFIQEEPQHCQLRQKVFGQAKQTAGRS